jgi:hypothetical protein
MSSGNAQLSISGSAYRHSTVGNWPFSRSDKAANKPEAGRQLRNFCVCTTMLCSGVGRDSSVFHFWCAQWLHQR